MDKAYFVVSALVFIVVEFIVDESASFSGGDGHADCERGELGHDPGEGAEERA